MRTVRLCSVGVRRSDAILKVLYVVLFCLAWRWKILFGSSRVTMRCFAQFSVIPICHGPSASLNRLARAELESAELCIRETKGRWYLTAKDQGDQGDLLEALRDVRHVRSIRRIVSCINTTRQVAQSLEAADWDSALRDLGTRDLGTKQRLTFCVVCKHLPKLTALVGDGNKFRQELGQCLERRLGWSAVGRGRSPDVTIHLHLEGPPIFGPCIFAEIVILQQDQMMIGGSLPFQGMHHVEAWAIARSLDIQDGDLVLDPMCGQGTLLAEAAIWWPNATYVGCDVNGSQLARCSANFAALQGRKVSLHEVNAVKFGGIPLMDRSVEKIMVAPPWNRQFAIKGRPQEFYEEMFRELFRVVRKNGRMVLFVSGRVFQRVKDALEVSESCWRIVEQRRFTITRKTLGIILILEPRLEECAARPRLSWEGDAPSDGRDLYEYWREVRARNFPRLTPVVT